MPGSRPCATKKFRNNENGNRYQRALCPLVQGTASFRYSEKTGETAESPVFMRLFAHVNENAELRRRDLVSIPPSPPVLQLPYLINLIFLVSVPAAVM